jgi:hypothetical protein
MESPADVLSFLRKRESIISSSSYWPLYWAHQARAALDHSGLEGAYVALGCWAACG